MSIRGSQNDRLFSVSVHQPMALGPMVEGPAGEQESRRTDGPWAHSV